MGRKPWSGDLHHARHRARPNRSRVVGAPSHLNHLSAPDASVAAGAGTDRRRPSPAWRRAGRWTGLVDQLYRDRTRVHRDDRLDDEDIAAKLATRESDETSRRHGCTPIFWGRL